MRQRCDSPARYLVEHRLAHMAQAGRNQPRDTGRPPVIAVYRRLLAPAPRPGVIPGDLTGERPSRRVDERCCQRFGTAARPVLPTPAVCQGRRSASALPCADRARICSRRARPDPRRQRALPTARRLQHSGAVRTLRGCRCAGTDHNTGDAPVGAAVLLRAGLLARRHDSHGVIDGSTLPGRANRRGHRSGLAAWHRPGHRGPPRPEGLVGRDPRPRCRRGGGGGGRDRGSLGGRGDRSGHRRQRRGRGRRRRRRGGSPAAAHRGAGQRGGRELTGPVSRPHRGRMGSGLRRQHARDVPRHPAGAAGDGRARARPHRQRLVHLRATWRRDVLQGSLQRVQGRADRVQPRAGARGGAGGHHRELRRARSRRHRHHGRPADRRAQGGDDGRHAASAGWAPSRRSRR